MSFESIVFVVIFSIVFFVVYFCLISYLLEKDKVQKFIKDYKAFEHYILLNQFNEDFNIDSDFVLLKLQDFNFNLYLLKQTKYKSLRERLDKIQIIDFAVFYKI